MGVGILGEHIFMIHENFQIPGVRVGVGKSNTEYHILGDFDSIFPPLDQA